MSEEIIRDIYSELDKKQILKIAEDLEIPNISPSDRVAVVIETILSDVEINGIPMTEDMSEDMMKFFVLARMIDEDGNLLGEETGQEKVEQELPEKLPDCFGMADPSDPACKHCRVLNKCIEERKKRKPQCFGKLYMQNADECQICIEQFECKKISPKEA